MRPPGDRSVISRSPSDMADATHRPPVSWRALVSPVTRPPPPRLETGSPSPSRWKDTGPRLDAMIRGRVMPGECNQGDLGAGPVRVAAPACGYTGDGRPCI